MVAAGGALGADVFEGECDDEKSKKDFQQHDCGRYRDLCLMRRLSRQLVLSKVISAHEP